tara:strand:+ start:1878 stop:2240 length:363 start_codon:yes stop_codon:yes gene_type:complete
MQTRFLIRLSLLGIALAFGVFAARAQSGTVKTSDVDSITGQALVTDRNALAKQTTPEQQIAFLRATVAAQAEDLQLMQQLLQVFQARPSASQAALNQLKAALEKECGGKVDGEGKCVGEK